MYAKVLRGVKEYFRFGFRAFKAVYGNRPLRFMKETRVDRSYQSISFYIVELRKLRHSGG
jgi:hypothetical protein